MITGLTVEIHPSIHVQMLIFLTGRGQIRADVHLVESLARHVEKVSISLLLVDLDDLVDESQPGSSDKSFQRIDNGELIEVTRYNDRCVLVYLQDSADEVCHDLILRSTILYAAIERRPGIAVEGGAAALGTHVNVDGEESACSTAIIDCFPLCNERYTGGVPRGVGWIETSWVQAETRSWENLCCLSGGSWVEVRETDHGRVEKVHITNVPSGLATFAIVYRVYIGLL